MVFQRLHGASHETHRQLWRASCSDLDVKMIFVFKQENHSVCQLSVTRPTRTSSTSFKTSCLCSEGPSPFQPCLFFCNTAIYMKCVHRILPNTWWSSGQWSKTEVQPNGLWWAWCVVHHSMKKKKDACTRQRVLKLMALKNRKRLEVAELQVLCGANCASWSYFQSVQVSTILSIDTWYFIIIIIKDSFIH